MHGRRNPTRNLPIVATILMNPFGIVSRIGKQRFGLDGRPRFVQQRPSHGFVIAWPPAQYDAGWKQRAAGDTQRQLHISLSFSTAASAEVRTGRCAFHSSRVDGHFSVRFSTLANHLTNNVGQNRIHNRQRVRAVCKVFQGRVMWQSPQSQAFFQGFRRVQKFDDPSIRRLQVRPQNQASHQLSLRELMRTLGMRVGLHVPPRELHAQPSNFQQSVWFGAHAQLV